jgi:hypothetical protein
MWRKPINGRMRELIFSRQWVLRLLCSVIWRHIVRRIVAKVSEEHAASAFNSTLKMDTARFSETAVVPWTEGRLHCFTSQKTVAARSKAWTFFTRSDTWIMGSDPTQGMDVCVVLCVGNGLATDRSPVQGVLPSAYRITKLKKRPRSKGL